ncbi:MAG: serine hydrolase [Saprospiraceae bacterium]
MKRYSVIILLLALSLGLPAQNLAGRIDSLIRADFDQPTGITVMVTQHGQTRFDGAYGWANVEQKVPMHTDDVFRLGSVTKQFTSSAILRLAEQGKLNIQDDIHKYFPGYPTEGHTITIEHLLTHTSGIPSYTDLPEWTPEVHKKDYTPAELIEAFKRDTLDFEPGSQFKYNNTGYFMLGYIIEKVSGMTYKDYLRTQFWEPLGMTHTYYGSNNPIIPNRIPGYAKNGDTLVNAPYLSMTQPYAAGSLLSTTGDLAIWNHAVFSDQVITAASRQKAHTPYVLNDGSPTRYGYGWFIGDRWEEATIEHSGGIHGFLTQSIYFPDEDLYIAALSNCNCFAPGSLANKIAGLVLGKSMNKPIIEVSPQKLQDYVGQYTLHPGFIITIFIQDDQLMAQATNQPALKLYATKPDRFFLKEVEAELEFLRKDDKVTELILHQGGVAQNAPRTQ